MPKIKVTFADGSTTILHEDQTFQTIVKTDYGTSLSQVFTLWSHHHDGLVPSLTEMLAHGLFFFDIEHPETIYSSASVVKLEKL
ncbi:hypothetical protein ABZ559_04930 [Streptococcus sp. ZY19097]|uniref:hypothetical protein n=1 Tax=Streptococcus sp. ZY19097 TaxID=3231906 RepID=UPI0034597644